MDDVTQALESFSGIARLFPLPNLVLFPSIVQGLHMFEPRYREMTADALADDRLLALVLLREGWEADYEGRPPVHQVCCVGRIVGDEQLDDGCYNLQLLGLRRARIVEELTPSRAYRIARIELLWDCNTPNWHVDAELRRKLERAIAAWCPGHESTAGVARKVLASNLGLGVVCDLLTHTLPLNIAAKQELLERLDVAERARHLLRCMSETEPVKPGTSSKSTFLPDFSAN
jgi:Lon protease-like protein